MKITCPSCAAKYTVSDEKVQGKTVKMKCRKCGATIVVGGASHTDQGPGDDATAVASADAGDPGQDLPAGSFLVNVNDGDQRTMTLAEVVAACQAGVLNADTYVWADGMADWQPLSENAAINGAMNGGTNGSASHPPPMAAPVPTPARSEPPRARESSRPAARRDSGRGRGDLFSGGMADGAGLSSSVSGQAGKRDENSVLFSLSSLTSATAPAAPSRTSTSTNKEDSGLIDLKALAAAGPSSPSAAAPVDAIGLFPLGAPVLAPPAASAIASPASLAPPAKKGTNMVLIMVMGGLLIAAIAVAVFFAVKGTATPPASTATAAPVAAQPTSTPMETAAPTATTAATATPDTSSSAMAMGSSSAGPKNPPAGWHPVPGHPNPPGPTPPGPTPPGPTPPPHPAGGGCACPPGDLMCAMQKCAGHH